MSALWITSYLLIVTLGASVAIISLFRLELWLQARRIRSRRHQHHQGPLLVGSGPESVLPVAEGVGARSSMRKNPLASFFRSTRILARVPRKRDGKSRSPAEPAGKGPAPDKKVAVLKRDPQNIAAPARANVSPSRPAPPARTDAGPVTKNDRPERKAPQNAGSGQASDGTLKNHVSTAPDIRPAILGATLDELYDRETATVISSELVDESEGQQEVNPDDIIEAGVL